MTEDICRPVTAAVDGQEGTIRVHGASPPTRDEQELLGELVAAARSWCEGDPEPPDHPSLVDKDDVTWLWDDEDVLDIPGYRRMVLQYLATGAVLGGPCALEWQEILEDYGPLREATAEEAGVVTAVFPGGRVTQR